MRTRLAIAALLLVPVFATPASASSSGSSTTTGVEMVATSCTQSVTAGVPTQSGNVYAHGSGTVSCNGTIEVKLQVKICGAFGCDYSDWATVSQSMLSGQSYNFSPNRAARSGTNRYRTVVNFNGSNIATSLTIEFNG